MSKVTLSLLYEEVKLLDDLGVPRFQLLDQAVPNLHPVKSQLLLKVSISFFAALFIGIFLVSLGEFRSRMKAQRQFPSPANSE